MQAAPSIYKIPSDVCLLMGKTGQNWPLTTDHNRHLLIKLPLTTDHLTSDECMIQYGDHVDDHENICGRGRGRGQNPWSTQQKKWAYSPDYHWLFKICILIFPPLPRGSSRIRNTASYLCREVPLLCSWQRGKKFTIRIKYLFVLTSPLEQKFYKDFKHDLKKFHTILEEHNFFDWTFAGNDHTNF